MVGDGLLKYMTCQHEYEGVDGTSRVVCKKCGIETTVEALARLGLTPRADA